MSADGDSSGKTAGAGDGALLSGQSAGGAAAPDWLQGIGDDDKSWVATKGYKSPADLVKAYRATEKIIGSDKIAVPGKDAKPEDWEPVWNKLGRPEKPEGYKLAKPENAAWYSDDVAKSFMAAAHKAGVPQAQAAALHDWWVNDMATAFKSAGEADAARHAKGAATLKIEWGQAFNENLELANRAVKSAPGLADELKALKLESAPALAKAMAMLGRLAFSEDGFVGGAAGGGRFGGGMTPEQAKVEEARLYADKDFAAAFLDHRHPGHAAAKEKMAAVQRAIHGEPK